jgi:transcriptional regulator with XRE-family HTH domain
MKNYTGDFLEKLGARLKSIREERKLTLNDMEFCTGIDLSDYNKIEQGKANITFRTFLKIAKGLKLHPSELINFEFDMIDYTIED